MKTHQLHLTLPESGLMCNLLHMAMEATGKKFEDQPDNVKLLSTKLARFHQKMEASVVKPAATQKTVFDK